MCPTGWWIVLLMPSRWCCLGTLWNLKEVEPCWWKGATEVYSLAPTSCSLSLWFLPVDENVIRLFLLPCYPNSGETIHQNKPFLPSSDASHGILSQKQKNNLSLKSLLLQGVVVVHIFSPNTQEAEAGESL